MLRKILEKILFILLALLGVFNIHGEVVIRLLRGTKYAGKAYNIYYLIPIRAHMLVALISFLFAVFLLSEVTKKRTTQKMILLIIYTVYVILYFDTLCSM